MNAPEKPARRRIWFKSPGRRPRVLREGETLVVRQAGDPVKFRRLAAKIRARLKPKRGVSVDRALAEARARNYR